MPRKRRKGKATWHIDWLPLWPQRGWHYAFWIRVAQHVRDRNVRSDDFATIKLICEEVENEFNKRGRDYL
jgi:hypothetical protein